MDCKKIIEIANANGWLAKCDDDGEGHVEFSFEQHSPLGEDVVVELDPCLPDQVVAKVREYANDFDPDDHARMWIENSSGRGVPQSVRELIDDADAIKQMLENLAQALEDLERNGCASCFVNTNEYTFDVVDLIADHLGWAILSQADRVTGKITYLFSRITPLGDYFHFDVEAHDALGIVKGVRSYADDFDTDDFARAKITDPDGPGIPNSIRALVNEGDEIKRMLTRLASALEHPEETHYTDHLAKVEWSIDDAIDAAEEQGVTLTREQATAWWIENQKWFAEQLTQTGNEMLSNVDWAEEAGEPVAEEGDPDA